MLLMSDFKRVSGFIRNTHMAVCQNLVPLVNIKIVGKWMFIPLKMVLIGIDPYPHSSTDPKTAAVPLLSILPPGRPSCLSEIVA